MQLLAAHAPLQAMQLDSKKLNAYVAVDSVVMTCVEATCVEATFR